MAHLRPVIVVVLFCFVLCGIQPARATTSPSLSDPTVSIASTPTPPQEAFVHKEAGVQFDLPKGWTAEPDGNQISIGTPDDSLAFVFLVSDEDSIEATIDALGSELDGFIENVEVTDDATEGNVNGLKVIHVGGSGEVDGTPIHWSVAVLLAKKPVIVLAIAEAASAEKYEATVERFISSIRPV